MNRTKCNHCGVYVEPQHSQCPLCQKPMEAGSESDTLYPNYEWLYRDLKQFTLHKLFLFLTITMAIVSVLVNVFTLKSLNFLWSPIVAASLFYSWVTYRNTAFSRMNMGGKILIQFLSLSLLALVLDIFTGFSEWSTTYVMPFLSVAMTLLLTIMAVTRKKRYKVYMGYLIAAFFISLAPIFLFVFNVSMHIWTSVTAITFSVFTFLGMLIFSPRQFKTEMKKRFHL